MKDEVEDQNLRFLQFTILQIHNFASNYFQNLVNRSHHQERGILNPSQFHRTDEEFELSKTKISKGKVESGQKSILWNYSDGLNKQHEYMTSWGRSVIERFNFEREWATSEFGIRTRT